MGNRTEPAAKGDSSTIISRMQWLSEQARNLNGELDLNPGPSFGFYQDRWSSDDLVRIMSMAEKGMHMDLICVAWQQDPPCSLPNDEVLLRAWCGHPDSENWTHHRNVLFSSEDGQIRRSWVFSDGRWWQVGLCRTLLEQVARRLRRQKASHARYAQNPKSTREKREHHRQLEIQCNSLLDALQSLPVPSPVPLPFPFPVPRESSIEDSGGDEPAETGDDPVELVWSCYLQARDRACKLMNEKPTAVRLTPRRREQIEQLLTDYGIEQIESALGAVERSDYHMGRGKHSGKGTRLSFEAMTRTDGRVNQIEILSQLAEQSTEGGGPPKPFAPDHDPQGDDDEDGSEID